MQNFHKEYQVMEFWGYLLTVVSVEINSFKLSQSLSNHFIRPLILFYYERSILKSWTPVTIY